MSGAHTYAKDQAIEHVAPGLLLGLSFLLFFLHAHQCNATEAAKRQMTTRVSEGVTRVVFMHHS